MLINKPLVSVIIANYNSEQYISKCLDSILNQTYQNIEIIICDDNSFDNSPQIILNYCSKYSNIRYISNSTNLRAAASRNNCLNVAQGDFIAIQDADDFSDINRIERQVNYLFENPYIDFVSSSAYLFEDNNYVSKGIMTFGKTYPTKWNFLWGMPFIHPATMFRKDCIRQVNGYRVCAETRRGQDYDMFMRMYATGFRGANIKEPLYWYRLDQNTVKRHAVSSSHDEYIVRLYGFKQLKLLPLGYLFAIKPFLANFAHYLGWFKY